jgi:hypothetical protein
VWKRFEYWNGKKVCAAIGIDIEQVHHVGEVGHNYKILVKSGNIDKPSNFDQFGLTFCWQPSAHAW